MKIRLEKAAMRAFRLPTVMLTLAAIAGFASVGQAQDIPQIVITAERPVATDTSAAFREEMQSTADSAVWKTQLSVAIDLGTKLTHEQERIRLAGNYDRKRG